MTVTHDIDHSGQPSPRKRSPGGGRKRKLDLWPTLGAQIESLVKFSEPSVDPVFRWTVKGTDTIANELRAMGVDVSKRVVGEYFRSLGFYMPSSRILSSGRGSDDVDRQFRFAAKTVLAQRDAGGAVVLLEGAATALPCARRYREEMYYCGPSKDMLLDEYSRQSFTPVSPFENYYAYREHERQEVNQNPNVRKMMRQKLYEATTLPLMNLITDRNPAIFTALAIRHWWQSGVASASGYHHGSILLLTHGASPDSVFPKIWKWAVSKICKELGVVISVCRIPPASWRFTGETWPLFSFTSQKNPDKTNNEGYLVKGSLAFHPCEELTYITGMCDYRRYPKSMKVSTRMLRAMNIRSNEPYGDWNYSFIPGVAQGNKS